MRRDILELDFSIGEKTHPEMVTLLDVDAIRLFLSGSSIIDWNHISFSTMDEVDQFLSTHRLDISDPRDRERLRYVYNESVSYLEAHLGLSFPKSLRNPADVREVFLQASPNNTDRRIRVRACTILKLMHVIQHMEAADLKFRNSLSEVTLFDWARTQLNESAQQMELAGLPIHSFYGSHKTRSGLLLCALLLLCGREAPTCRLNRTQRSNFVRDRPVVTTRPTCVVVLLML